MKLLIAVDTFFPDFPGGMARVAWDVAKALARRGHDVGLVAGDHRTGGRQGKLREFRRDGVDVFIHPKPSPRAWNPFRAHIQMRAVRRAVTDVLGRKRWDAVHAHSIYTGNALLGASARPPLVLTVHSLAIQEIIYNWHQQGLRGEVTALAGSGMIRRLEQRSLSASSAIHVLSHYTASQMVAEYPSGQRQPWVIPHWADASWFRTMPQQVARDRLGWAQDAPILFTVRQLRHRYGIDTAIAAVAPLAAQGKCLLFVAGDGPDLPQLKALAEQAGVAERVRFLGRISDAELRLAYQAADLFVLPTRALECFGLIVLEAYACGLPVVATDVGAIPESVAPVAPGLLVPPDDPQALGAKLGEFLDGRAVPVAGEPLADYVRTKYSEDTVLAQYERMYQAVFDG